MTRDDLLAFRDKVKDAFLAKKIHAPVHLCADSQAEPLIEIFKQVRPTDWVCSNWRSMFHALLKGIPEDELFQMILDGRSMYIHSAEHRFLASSIVGGMLPVACGLAMGIQRRGGSDKVWVMVGEMTARTGLFHEFLQYADGHKLPVVVVIEDNGLSTNTPTDEVWGGSVQHVATEIRIISYQYERDVPHVGVGRHVVFN